MPTTPKIEILDLEAVERGSLRAVLKIRLRGNLVINNVKLIAQPGREMRAMPPQVAYTCANGYRCYSNVVEWPREWGEKITALAVDAWNESRKEVG